MMNERFTDESEEEFGVDEPRSIFAALWFRIVVGVAALGVISAVAIPHVLDWTRPPVLEKTVTAAAPAPTPDPPASTPVPDSARPLAPAPSVPAAMAGAPAAAPSPAAAPTARTESTSPAAPMPSSSLPVTAAMVSEIKPSTDAPTPPRSVVVASTPGVRTDKTPARMTGVAGGGAYWVQVGAYRDAATAERMAARLRELGYHVSEVGPAPAVAVASVETPPATPASEPGASPGDKYDVVVSGAPAAKITERLVGKGLMADVTATGVVVKPPMALPDAVALSRELANDGLRVQVRRGGVAAAKPTPAKSVSPVAAGPDALHRVRVGAYPDRATAEAAVRELAGKGYEGFVARSAP